MHKSIIFIRLFLIFTGTLFVYKHDGQEKNDSLFVRIVANLISLALLYVCDFFEIFNLPQFLIIGLTILSLLFPSKRYNFALSCIATAIIEGILFWGGFYDPIL